MAYDKVVDSSVLDAGLKTIADAIRAKAGTSGNLAFPAAMAEAIAAIEAGGGNVETGVYSHASNITADKAVISFEKTSKTGVPPTKIIAVSTETGATDTGNSALLRYSYQELINTTADTHSYSGSGMKDGGRRTGFDANYSGNNFGFTSLNTIGNVGPRFIVVWVAIWEG